MRAYTTPTYVACNGVYMALGRDPPVSSGPHVVARCKRLPSASIQHSWSLDAHFELLELFAQVGIFAETFMYMCVHWVMT